MRASARGFDAVMFLSRNGTRGEAGVGLKPLSVPKFRMLSVSTIGGGGDTTIPSPGRSSK